MTASAPVYSPLFRTIYDEPSPVGHIGRGTHYSVLRCVEWFDVCRARLDIPHRHDFAVIWDEDHDTRVIEAIERLYVTGLLAPVQFIGERKGTLSVVIAARAYWGMVEHAPQYKQMLETAIGGMSHEDSWSLELGQFDRSLGSPHQYDPAVIIQDRPERVEHYLRNIDNMWSLGTHPWLESDFTNFGEGLMPPNEVRPVPVPPLPTPRR